MVRRKAVAPVTAAGDGSAPVLGPALGCLWGEEEKLGFPLPWGGTSLGRSALLKVFCSESPGKINPFVNRTLPGSLPGPARQDPDSEIPADAPAPRNQQAVQALAHSRRQAGSLGRGPVRTSHSLCVLPSSRGAPPVQHSHCASGAQRPRPAPPRPGHLGSSLRAPSQPLAQGFPRPRGKEEAPPPRIGVARPAPAPGPPGARIPVQPSRRPPSVRAQSCPQPRSIPVSPRRRPPDCSRGCRHRRPAAAAAAREGASPRAEGGGGAPLPSARPLPYAPLPPRTAPAPRSPPAPPGQPEGATRARPRVTRATGRVTTRATSLPLPTRASWGCPLPKPRAPPANGHRGSWPRQGAGGNGEGSTGRPDL